MKSAITVVHADRHYLLRDAVSTEISKRSPHIRFIGEAGTFSDLYGELEMKAPDILIISHQLLDGKTIENIDAIKNKFPKLKIIILTMLFLDQVRAQFKGKANGFVGKSMDISKLIEAIETSHVGGMYF